MISFHRSRVFGTSFILALSLFLPSCTFFDAESPVLIIDSPAPGATVTAGQVFLVSGRASDNGKLRDVTIRVDNGAYAAVDGLTNWNVLVTVPSTGSHYLTVRAYDVNSNVAYAYLQVTGQ